MEGTDFLNIDDKEAYRWFKKVSDLGNTDGDYYLGMLLQNQEKYEQAERWYRRGAEKGDAYCQYALGYFYEHGLGVTQNFKQAKAWYSEAAEQEHANAQFAMGLFLVGMWITKKLVNGMSEVPSIISPPPLTTLP